MRSRQPTYLPVTVHGELPGQFIAARIRTAFFPTVRHGYQPEAVRHLLAQAADEITRLQQRLAAVYAENDQIKAALKQWQSDHAATCRRTDPDTRTHWPINRS
jgi:hypothetical protein